MMGLTVSLTHLPVNNQSSNSRYPFLHLQLRPVSVAFLPLKGQQRQSETCPNHSGGGGGGGTPPVPAWPSPAGASGPPAPGPCPVTGPSASRSQPGSARRAATQPQTPRFRSKPEVPSAATATTSHTPSCSLWRRLGPGGWSISSDSRRSHGWRERRSGPRRKSARS